MTVSELADIMDTGNNTDTIDLSQTLTHEKDDLSFYTDYQPTKMAEIEEAQADEYIWTDSL